MTTWFLKLFPKAIMKLTPIPRLPGYPQSVKYLPALTTVLLGTHTGRISYSGLLEGRHTTAIPAPTNVHQHSSSRFWTLIGDVSLHKLSLVDPLATLAWPHRRSTKGDLKIWIWWMNTFCSVSRAITYINSIIKKKKGKAEEKSF